MYLRATQRRNKDGSVVRYLALAENVRDAEKGYVEARVVHSFGRADELDRAALERLVRSIRRVLDEDAPVTADKAPAADLAIDKVEELGIAHVARALWLELGIGAAIRSRLKARKLAAPHEAALLAMTVQRLDEPGSKLACWQRWLDQVWLPEARDLGLEQLYRALDLLALEAEAIEQEVFWHAVDLFKLEVDLVFYDATTAWFATEDEDVAEQTWRGLTFPPLRKRGHSKEGRDNDPQVIVGLAVTREGVPIRSWVFPGNMPDVSTVQRIKDDLRAMQLGRVLFVGDAGLYSKANLAELARGAGRYVLATPLAKMKEVRGEVLARPGRYASITPELDAKEVIVGEGERRRRYILCLNREEAARQQHRRQRLLEQLQAELEALGSDHPKAACRLLASRRFGPYLGQDAHGRPFVDRDKVKAAQRLDGKFVLTSNDDTLSVADIALGYKGLWIIESCFRKMKTTGLELRPMFHWAPQRITAHVKLCVLALLIQRTAEIRTGETWARLQDRLRPLKVVHHSSEGRRVAQTTRLDTDLRQLFTRLGVPAPKPVLAVA
jgi:Transposase DDE domain